MCGGCKLIVRQRQPDRLVDVTAKRESTEITTLLNDSVLLRPSSVELGWKSFVIERRTILPGEKPELNLQHHFLILWDGHVAEGEIAFRGGRFAPFKKYPNTVTTCPPGIRPAARSRIQARSDCRCAPPGFHSWDRRGTRQSPEWNFPAIVWNKRSRPSESAPSSAERIGDRRAIRDSLCRIANGRACDTVTVRGTLEKATCEHW